MAGGIEEPGTARASGAQPGAGRGRQRSGDQQARRSLPRASRRCRGVGGRRRCVPPVGVQAAGRGHARAGTRGAGTARDHASRAGQHAPGADLVVGAVRQCATTRARTRWVRRTAGSRCAGRGRVPTPRPNRPVQFFPGAWGELEWQCVELSMRFMYVAYGVKPYGANGKDVYANYTTAYGGNLVKIAERTPGARRPRVTSSPSVRPRPARWATRAWSSRPRSTATATARCASSARTTPPTAGAR